MLEFMDQDTSDLPPKEQSSKLRAVLLAGEKVWGVDHVATETLMALDEVNSEVVVAVHPIGLHYKSRVWFLFVSPEWLFICIAVSALLPLTISLALSLSGVVWPTS